MNCICYIDDLRKIYKSNYGFNIENGRYFKDLMNNTYLKENKNNIYFMKHLKSYINFSINESDDYRIDHRAPNSDGDTPLYNLEDIYGDDIYGPNALRYFGTKSPYDSETIAIMQSVRDEPDHKVKIYRAVPKVLTNSEKISRYEDHLNYINKTGEFPKGITNWENVDQYRDYLQSELEKLKTLDDNPEIKDFHSGDWVSINKNYAIEHGKRNLNNDYSILSKVVKAKDIFTDGNSIHEYGYDPQD